MWFSYQLPIGILECLTNSELCECSCVARALEEDTRVDRVQRKKIAVASIMSYFHSPGSLIFSLHRTFQQNFENNLRQLFRILPEWFHYLETHQISYLDMSNPFFVGKNTYLSIVSCIFPNDIHRVSEEFLNRLSHNTTLLYCNLGMFHHVVSRQRIEQAVQHHPSLYQVEMILYSNDSKQTNSLYRMGDGTFEWRAYPPRN